MSCISKRIANLQDSEYVLIEHSEKIEKILKRLEVWDKIRNLTPWNSPYSIDYLIIKYCDFGYEQEVWAINDAYCGLKSYAYLVYKEGGLNV